jgi:hypothetical protein
MESFGTEMAAVWFLVGMGLSVGDQGGHAVKGFMADLGTRMRIGHG